MARRPLPMLAVAGVLALGSAVSLGLARFSYALLLGPMRADLGWSYFTAGAMNTLNAVGYLVGALLTARALGRVAAGRLFVGGTVGTGVVLGLHGAASSEAALYGLRFLAGVGSAATFVSGGLLAARLVTEPRPGARAGGGASAGLVLGIYYGGTGLGIVCAALLVPPLVERTVAHSWQGAWVGLGGLALAAAAVLASVVRSPAPPNVVRAEAPPAATAIGAFAPALASYLLFGLGYIGYMTFVVTLLREQGLGPRAVVVFYVLLGLAVVASSWLWARLLQRARGGGAMCLLNALLAIATALPVLSGHPVAVFASGLLFGAVFLSVVASTTALVRHNVAATHWGRWIGAFTIAFALGQIVGPSLVGWVADATGGLRAGLACSAGVLLLAAVAAWWQRPLAATGSAAA